MDPEHCLYLGDNGVQDIALEGAEDDGLVLDGIDDKPLARLDQTRPQWIRIRGLMPLTNGSGTLLVPG
jgi:hypothetical protein